MEDRIATTITRLSDNGLTKNDQRTLTARFVFLWIERPGETKTSSKWRIDLVRDTFRDVLAKSAHLFFVLALLLTPTQCGQRAFINSTIEPLLRSDSYNSYRFFLGPQDKEFLVKTAKDKGFLQKSEFLAVMHALFPEGWTHEVDHTDFSRTGDRSMYIVRCHLRLLLNESTAITYAYSKMPRSNLPLLLHILAQAIERSNLVAGEMQKGDEKTGAVTVLIPAGDVDCSCSITVSRPVITEALGQFDFTQVYEKNWAPF